MGVEAVEGSGNLMSGVLSETWSRSSLAVLSVHHLFVIDSRRKYNVSAQLIIVL